MHHENPTTTNNCLRQELTQLQKQMLSLEISLREASKSSIISSRDYKKRTEMMSKTQQRMNQLSLVLNNKNQENSPEAIETPDISRCSYDELLICNHFLNNRLEFIRESYHYLHDIYRRALKASRGEGRSILNIIHLSRMKRIIGRIDGESSQAELDEKALYIKSEQLTKSLTKKTTKELETTNNSRSFIKVFSELDGISTRISRLKSAIVSEQQEIEKLQNEAGDFSNNTQNKPHLEVPDLEKLKSMSDYMRKLTIDPMEDNKNQLDLARHFLNDCEDKIKYRGKK